MAKYHTFPPFIEPFPEGNPLVTTASEMHVAPRISKTAPDMPEMMPQTLPRHAPDDLQVIFRRSEDLRVYLNGFKIHFGE